MRARLRWPTSWRRASSTSALILPHPGCSATPRSRPPTTPAGSLACAAQAAVEAAAPAPPAATGVAARRGPTHVRAVNRVVANCATMGAPPVVHQTEWSAWQPWSAWPPDSRRNNRRSGAQRSGRYRRAGERIRDGPEHCIHVRVRVRADVAAAVPRAQHRGDASTLARRRTHRLRRRQHRPRRQHHAHASGCATATPTRWRSPRPHDSSRRGRPTGAGWRSRHDAARRTSRRRCVLPMSGPGETHDRRAAGGFATLQWSPDGKHIASCRDTRDARYDARTRLAGTARSRRSSPRSTARVSCATARSMLRRRRRRHGCAAISRLARSPATASPGCPTRRRSSPPALATTSGTSTRPPTCFVSTSTAFTVDCPQRCLHLPVGVPRRHQDRRARLTRLAAVPQQPGFVFELATPPPTAVHGSTPPPRSTARSPYPGARPPVWLDDSTLLAAAEDRGRTRLSTGRRWVGGPERATDGAMIVQAFDAVQVDDTLRLATAAPSISRPAVRLVGTDARRLTALNPAGRGGNASPSPPPTAATRSTRGSCVRPTSTRRRPIRYCSTHGGPFTQYGRRAATRPRCKRPPGSC